MKKFTRERVVPIISARVSWEILGTTRCGLSGFTVAGQKKQRARQAFFAGIEELVDQIFFDADIAPEHVGNEAVGEFVLGVEHANHFLLFDDQSDGVIAVAEPMQRIGPAETSFAEKIAGA